MNISLKNVELNKGTAAQYQDLNQSNYIELMVSDTGHEITPAIKDRIFASYFTQKVGEGTGMELAIVHCIVKNFRGSDFRCSEQGKGSSFQILFPEIMDGIKIKSEMDADEACRLSFRPAPVKR